MTPEDRHVDRVQQPQPRIARRRILIFGGTFDPPHRAHVELPELARRALDAERVVYVPAALNPLKAQAPPTPAAHRLAMLEIALRDQAHVEICTIELDRDGPSYMVDTLRELHAVFGADVDLYLLIGADQALQFSEWKDWRLIPDLALPIVMLRPPWDQATFADAVRERYDEDEAERWLGRVVEVPLVDVDATGVRERLRDGDDAPEVPGGVMDYIRAHGLYRS